MAPTATTTDVLIVGAGPVGMTLAMELSLQGVSFRIVEKSPERSDKSRALGVHSRTVEVLDRYGDGVGDLLAKASRVKGNDIWVGGRRFEALGGSSDAAAAAAAAKATPTPTDTRFPGIFVISQVDTEAFLERRLRERGVAVERATAASHIAQDADGVTVTLRKGEEEEEEEEGEETQVLRCRYVVGCDGAHSAVRHAMDVRFEGDAYPQEFILADTAFDWAPAYFDGTRAQLFLGDGMALMLPLGPGRARFVASRSKGVGVAASDADAEPTLRDFEACLEGMLPLGEGEAPSKRPRLHDASWLARFHLHHRCVTKYRDGRLFVAGDAAHIHSPVGGQGMNTGIQDSVNLGWKLARALAAAGPSASADALLDTYHEERWPVGQHLLHETDQMFTFLSSAEPSFTFMRGVLLPHALPSMARDPALFPGVMRYFSQLDVKYRRSRAVRTAAGFDGPVRGGFRAPDGPLRTAEGDAFLQGLLRGPGHHLLLFAAGAEGEAAVEEARRKFLGTERKNAQVHIIGTAGSSSAETLVDVGGELHKRYGFEAKSGYVFVRPDGYVEDIGYLDAFVEFLKQGLEAQGGQ